MDWLIILIIMRCCWLKFRRLAHSIHKLTLTMRVKRIISSMEATTRSRKSSTPAFLDVLRSGLSYHATQAGTAINASNNAGYFLVRRSWNWIRAFSPWASSFSRTLTLLEDTLSCGRSLCRLVSPLPVGNQPEKCKAQICCCIWMLKKESSVLPLIRLKSRQ